MSKTERPLITAEHLDYGPEDEHLLRRLGAAAAFQWDALPEAARDLLLRQATMMWDRHETVQLNEQLQLFIRKHKEKKRSERR